jgi:hypothetical protein
VVTENNLVIVTGDGDDRTAHVVLSGRLAMSRLLEGDEAAHEVTEFIAQNYERYKSKPVERGELEQMTIVARWLRERTPDEGHVLYLNGPQLDPTAFIPELKEASSPVPLPTIGKGLSLNLVPFPAREGVRG